MPTTDPAIIPRECEDFVLDSEGLEVGVVLLSEAIVEDSDDVEDCG